MNTAGGRLPLPLNKKKLQPDFRVILFDVDGTLLNAVRRREYRELMCRMLVDIFGTEGRLREVNFAGQTDLGIFRRALESEGIGTEEILARLPELKTCLVRIVTTMSEKGELFRLCPGVEALLDVMARDPRFVTALLTGNLEELARTKLRLVGIQRYFPFRGAFGSDADNRNHLPAIAAGRLRDQLGRAVPPHRMVIVGDTPRDIECARHYGARVVAVASGSYPLQKLDDCDPDALLSDLSKTDEVVKLLAEI